jgi:hypothetical protein
MISELSVYPFSLVWFPISGFQKPRDLPEPEASTRPSGEKARHLISAS